jgi:hypothetical protein
MANRSGFANSNAIREWHHVDLIGFGSLRLHVSVAAVLLNPNGGANDPTLFALRNLWCTDGLGSITRLSGSLARA